MATKAKVIIVPPGDDEITPPKKTSSKKIGHVVNKQEKFAKILTNSLDDGKSRIILFYHKGTADLKLGEAVTFELGSFQDRITAINVETISGNTNLSKMFEELENYSAHSAVKTMSQSTLAQEFMLNEKITMKKLFAKLGINEVIALYDDTIVYK